MVSQFRAGLACSFMAFAVPSSGCARPHELPEPAIPTVVSIPVAPLLPAVTQSPPASAVAPEAPPAAPPSTGVTIAAPPSAAEPPPAPAPKPLVVLVDELPYHWSHLVAKEASERPHASRAKRGHGGRPYHPGPSIVVDTTEDQGGPGTADLQRVARSAGYWPFRRCYEEGLRRDPGLAGKVSLDVAVAVNGLVERAEMVSATLRDESVALCIGREAAHLAFAQREAPTRTTIDVSLSAGDEPVTVPRPAPHADELREALRTTWPAVEQCYASELSKRPGVGGRMELRFRARSSGEIVEVAEEGEPRFADVDVTRCVLGVYRSTRLPPARVCTARETTFGYAIHLEAR
jgi:hypothetical protein